MSHPLAFVFFVLFLLWLASVPVIFAYYKNKAWANAIDNYAEDD